MAGRLQGKRAIVTGAGQGIGEAIARLFAAHGAQLFIGEVHAETGQAGAESILTGGGRAVFVQTDVTNKGQVARLAETVVTLAGGIDVLVNNAGANVFFQPLEMPEDAWKRCMDLDLEAAWT